MKKIQKFKSNNIIIVIEKYLHKYIYKRLPKYIYVYIFFDYSHFFFKKNVKK